MNAITNLSRFKIDPLAHPLDRLLAMVAVRVQLPPGLHAKACERFEALRNHLEREGSPLCGRIVAFYPQGSMAIDATISTRGTDEDYDLDVVLEADLWGYSPGEILDLLEQALADYPAPVVRQTRCVTINYADRMHIDVTPSLRLCDPREKVSQICHANPDRSREHEFVPMNAFGFAQWYRDRTPDEPTLAEVLSNGFGEDSALAAAEVHEVPDQTPLGAKSTTTVALQLIKRARHIAYAQTLGRWPPSVMLSCHAGITAKVGISLSEAVIRQARFTENRIHEADRRQRLLHTCNPTWDADVFTDRWPTNSAQQLQFARHLGELAGTLERARVEDVALEDLSDRLRDLFGARVVGRAVEVFNDELGRSLHQGQQRYTNQGGIYLPPKPGLLVGTGTLTATRARSHTNMGGAW